MVTVVLNRCVVGFMFVSFEWPQCSRAGHQQPERHSAVILAILVAAEVSGIERQQRQFIRVGFTARFGCCCSELYLGPNALSAADWTALTALNTLSVLDLHGNRLYGTIPPTVSQLTALTLLDVSQTGVTALPSTFANMTALRCVLAGRLCVLSSEF